MLYSLQKCIKCKYYTYNLYLLSQYESSKVFLELIKQYLIKKSLN